MKVFGKKHEMNITFQLYFPFILHRTINIRNLLHTILINSTLHTYWIIISTTFCLPVTVFGFVTSFCFLSIFAVIFTALYVVSFPSSQLFYWPIFEFHTSVSLSLC